MAEIEKINQAAEIAKLKRGSFLGDMYKVREIMIQRRKEKAEQEEREKAALAEKEQAMGGDANGAQAESQ